MRIAVADFAAFALVLGLAGCGTGGGSAPQGGGGTSTPKPTATPTANPTATPTVTPTPTQTPSSSTTPAFDNWSTYGYDNYRDGFNPDSTAITPTSLSTLHLAWLQSVPDQKTQTQPLLATNLAGHTGILMVGGAEGNFFAYDALTGKPIWERSLGSATITCPGTPASPLGVGGTAVYDPSTQTVYVSSNLNTTSNGPSQLFINKISAADGSLLGSVNFAPSPLSGEVNFTHTSLTLANGVLYAGTGSTCDISSWRGRIVAVNAATMTLENTFYPVWNQTQSTTTAPAPYSGGGVWGWGGVSIDATGNVWAAVGNLDVQSGATGPQTPFVQDPNDEFDAFGEHLVQLTPNLGSVLQSNYPGFKFSPPQSVDLDISGTPVIGHPIACHETAAVQGKSGYLYIYNTGAVSSGPVDSLKFTTSSYNDPNLGNPAFSPVTGMYYAAVASSVAGGINPAPGMIAVNPCDTTSSVVWATAFGPDSQISGTPRSMPTVTAGGVVFLATPCRRDGNGGCTGSGLFGGAVWALDASSGAILNNGRPIVTTPKAIRMGPIVDGDWVYVFDNYGALFGLTIDPKYPTIPNTLVRTR